MLGLKLSGIVTEILQFCNIKLPTYGVIVGVLMGHCQTDMNYVE